MKITEETRFGPKCSEVCIWSKKIKNTEQNTKTIDMLRVVERKEFSPGSLIFLETKVRRNDNGIISINRKSLQRSKYRD